MAKLTTVKMKILEERILYESEEDSLMPSMGCEGIVMSSSVQIVYALTDT